MNSEIVIFIGDRDCDDPDYTEPGGYDKGSIASGLPDLAKTLFQDHDPYWTTQVGDPWPDLVKDEENYYGSLPFFTPICGFGCCGAADFGVYLKGDTVRIIAEAVPADKEYVITLDEYLDMIFRCLEELYKIKDFELMYTFLKKAASDGREEVKLPLLTRLKQFEAKIAL